MENAFWNAETSTVTMKIIGAVLAFLSFRWVVKIFKGPDKVLSNKEFKDLVAVILFVGLALYVVYKQGERTDLEHDVYGPVWLAIIFGSLLVVLHLKEALVLILQIAQTVRGGTSSVTTEASSTTKVTTNEPSTTQGS